ncbi:hypothetical protein DQQ10_06290 [Pseudochryseolinea flava]|uniref:Uncharacterized protein n=2 Tax=Pseudochryseolinea flava TaxID=2059302 RepID=A0A364Y5N9_9BACT|nr:hypothetical protein DQQ10_06290 [Pseudochryseolinea flava]
MIFIGACEPIEDRDKLKNTYEADDIQLEVIQTANGKGNGLTLKMNTPGVIGYWDYLIDKKFTDEVKVIFPIPGTHTFTYHVTTPLIKGGNPSDREVVSKTIQVTIEELDQELPADYYDLVGAQLQGKSWVFDRGSANWWYMSPNPANGGNPFGVWWNASECCAPSDQAGKMVFDLDGGANYSYYTDADNAEPTATGTFSFNGDFTKFNIGGGINILGADGTADVNGCAKSLGSFAQFTIVELTAERLVLYIPDASCTSGWTWIFVPEED